MRRQGAFLPHKRLSFRRGKLPHKRLWIRSCGRAAMRPHIAVWPHWKDELTGLTLYWLKRLIIFLTNNITVVTCDVTKLKNMIQDLHCLKSLDLLWLPSQIVFSYIWITSLIPESSNGCICTGRNVQMVVIRCIS